MKYQILISAHEIYQFVVSIKMVHCAALMLKWLVPRLITLFSGDNFMICIYCNLYYFLRFCNDHIFLFKFIPNRIQLIFMLLITLVERI